MNVRKIAPAPSAHGYPLLIKTLLRQPLIHSPGQEIVCRDRTRYDYASLERRVACLAGALEMLGAKPGDTVGILDHDSHRYLETLFAVPMAGCILHTVNFNRSPENLAYTINHAGASLLLVHADMLPLLSSIQDRLKAASTIIVMTDDGNVPETELKVAGEYETLLAAQPGNYIFPDFDDDAVATVLYTTGVSGTPKGVYFSHRQLVLHTYGVMAALCAHPFSPGIRPGDVYMPLSPMYHVHAWGLPYLFTLLGARQVYPGKFEPSVVAQLLRTEGVTFSNGRPDRIHSLLQCPEMQHTDPSGWKVLIGGAPLQPALCEEALNRGIDICSVYGMSETGPMLAVSALKPHMKAWDRAKQAEFRCRTGHPIPMVELKVLDITGQSLPHDGRSIGEIVVRAPWLAQSYVRDPEQSEHLWKNGWLHTGDIGFVDPEGYLQITDRVKEAIKTGGEWVASAELEDIICLHEAVNEAAVTAVPDEMLGEKPIAFVVLKPGYEDRITDEDIRRFCLEHVESGDLPSYAVPDKIAIVDTIPTTAVGKINRRQLRVQHEKPFNLLDGP